jgi:hypothetical protein
MEPLIKITGVLMILLSSIHLVFPKRFEWKKNLQGLNLINKEMMYIHTFFVALVVFLMGLLCIISAADLVRTKLGKRICFGFFVFWGIRLILQFFGYSSALWKGKKFETIMHVVFSILWVYLTTVFLVVYLKQS